MRLTQRPSCARQHRDRRQCVVQALKAASSDVHSAMELSRRAMFLAGGALCLLPNDVANAAGAVETALLGGSVQVSRVIKGCWQLSGGHRGDPQTDRTSGRAALEDFTTFYNNGITSFDAADHYGPAEVLIGKWIKQQSEATGEDVRKNVQILTKVCVFDGMSMATVSGASMRQAVDTSVRRLGTTPDVVQFYWGDYGIPRYVDAAKYLADEQARGQFSLLGATNFDVKHIQEMTSAGVKFSSNQLQYSLLDRRPENGMAAFCESQDIQLIAYGALAGGLLSSKYLGVPASSVTLDTFSKRKYARVLEESGNWEWFQSLLRVLQSVADKHGTTLSNIATRWVMDRPGVAGVIVGARNASHITDHVALSSFKLDAEDVGAIDQVLKAGKQSKGDCYEWERGLSSW